MADEKHGLVVVLPDKWFLMSDEEIHAWRVEHGYEPPGPYDPFRRARELGLRMAMHREEAVLKAFLGDHMPIVPGTGTEVVPLDLLPTDDVLPDATVAHSPPDAPRT